MLLNLFDEMGNVVINELKGINATEMNHQNELVWYTGSKKRKLYVGQSIYVRDKLHIPEGRGVLHVNMENGDIYTYEGEWKKGILMNGVIKDGIKERYIIVRGKTYIFKDIYKSVNKDNIITYNIGK